MGSNLLNVAVLANLGQRETLPLPQVCHCQFYLRLGLGECVKTTHRGADPKQTYSRGLRVELYWYR